MERVHVIGGIRSGDLDDGPVDDGIPVVELEEQYTVESTLGKGWYGAGIVGN
ncbi:MAG: hypothetical protein GY818_14965 [Planctomycetaceae bacterium]|nr:hypothetical protein [Planctomycetaceae bacterium]